MDESDAIFHQTNKPRWTYDGTLIYAVSGSAPKLKEGVLTNLKGRLVSEHKDIRFAKLATPADVSTYIPVLYDFRANAP